MSLSNAIRLQADSDAQWAMRAIGGLDVLVAGSPLRQAWLRRILLREAVRQARELGHEVAEIDVMATLAGLRGSARRDGGGVAEAVRRLVRLSRLQLAIEEHGPGGRGAHTSIGGIAALDVEAGVPPLVAAVAAARELDLDDVPRLPVTLAHLGITNGILPCLTGVAGRPDVDRMLDDLRKEAEHGTALFRRLRDTWRDWQRRLGKRRATSRLPHLVDFAMAAGFVTSDQAMRHLGITQRGAQLLLGELTDLGILVKLSGRGHIDVFLTPDLAQPTAAAEEDPRQADDLRPGDVKYARLAEENPAPIETDLGDLMRDLDAAIDRVNRALRDACDPE